MIRRLVSRGRRLVQEAIILVVRPYICRELPGWGKVYAGLVGDYRRNWFWRGAPQKVIRGKVHGFLMHLDITHWGDRVAYFLGRWYELETQLFIGDLIKPGDTVVDIGANRGMFTLCAARLAGPSGRVISIEPNPASRQQLETEIESNGIKNVIIHSCGVSDSAATLVLNVPKMNSGEASFGNKTEVADDFYQIEALLVRADSLLQEMRPSLIKIDVEGFESYVIGGLSETLARHFPVIITEVVQQHLEACGSSLENLTALMKASGYTGYRLITEKKKGKYVWGLRPMSAGENAYNAVWVHGRSSEESAVAISTRVDSNYISALFN